MGEILGRASVQHGDWRGTVAMDNRAHALIDQYLSTDPETPLGFVVAFDIYLGESDTTFLTLYIVPEAGGYDDVQRIANESEDGVVDVVRYSVEDAPAIEPFLSEMSKRFMMRLRRRGYESLELRESDDW